MEFYISDCLRLYRADFHDLFVSTEAFIESAGLLEQHHALVVTGVPGSGKTMMSQQLLMKICDEQNCNPFQPTVPEEYIRWCNTRERQAFMIDDMFGESNFNQAKYEAWVNILPKMVLHLRLRNTYIIFACRFNILKSHLSAFKKNTIINVINISEEKFRLSDKNKEDIFDNHAKKFKITDQKYDAVKKDRKMKKIANKTVHIREPIGFPQCVRLYCSMKNVSPKHQMKFFECPMEYLSNIISSYRENDHLTYCVLIMLLLDDGQLPVSSLLFSNRRSEKIQTCIDTCRLPSSTTMGELMDTADDLCGSLLFLENESFEYQHHSIMEAVTLDFGKKYPSYILGRCSMQFLLERVFTIESAPADNDYVVILQPVMFSLLCTRLLAEIRRCLDLRLTESVLHSLRYLSSYSVFKDDAFSDVFLKRLVQENAFHLLFISISPHIPIIDNHHPTFVFLAATVGQETFVCKVFTLYLLNVKQIPQFRDHMNRVLYATCYSGRPGAVKTLLRAGADPGYISAHEPNELDGVFRSFTSKCSTLMHAAYSSNVEVLHLICDGLQKQHVGVKAYLALTYKESWNRTAFHWWADGVHEATALSFLLKSGANVNVMDCYGKTPLHSIAWDGDEVIIKHLINAGADINVEHNGGDTALHICAIGGHVNAVRNLIAAGVNLNIISQYRGTALHICARCGDIILARLLLKAGADVTIRDHHGESALHSCALKIFQDTIQMLLDRRDDILNFAILSDYSQPAPLGGSHLAVLQLLLEAEANAEVRDRYRIETLRKCVLKGYRAIVELISDATSCINDTNMNTWTDLYMNVRYSCVSGADINMMKIDGEHALIRCAELGYLSFVRILIDAGANVHKSSKSGTALHIAARKVYQAHIEALLKTESNFKMDDKSNSLEASDSCIHEAVVQVMLQALVEVKLRDSYHLAALHSCALGGYEAVGLLQREAGADFNKDQIRTWTDIYMDVKYGKVTGRDVNTISIDEEPILLKCAEYGYLSFMKSLIEAGVDVNVVNMYGETALHFIAWSGPLLIVEQLLTAGADINMKNNCKRTALHLSARNGHVPVVKQLLSSGADVDMRDGSGTALHIAAEEGHVTVVRALLEKGADITARNIDGLTALHICAREVYRSMIQTMMTVGPSADAVDTYRPTASGISYDAVLRVLLQAENDDELRNTYDPTTLLLCAQTGYTAVVQPLIEQYVDADSLNQWSSLYMDIRYSHLSNSNVDRMTIHGVTSLHMCAECDRVYLLQNLIDAGVDINMTNKCGQTALHIGAEHGHVFIVRALLEKKADVNMRNADGVTALHLCARQAYQAIILEILEAECTVNKASNSTALHASDSCNYDAVLEVLLDAEADGDLRDKYGLEALRLCALKGHETIIKPLLESDVDEQVIKHLTFVYMDVVYNNASGADVNKMKIFREPVLHLSSQYGCSTMVRMLLTAGADVDMKDIKGCTALHHGAQHGHLTVVQLLMNSRADVTIESLRVCWKNAHEERYEKMTSLAVAVFFDQKAVEVFLRSPPSSD